MALVFPRPMPADGVDSQAFRLDRVDLTTGQVSGRITAVTLGWPLWRMTLRINNADADQTSEWTGFLDSLRGAQRPFLARDLTRPYPAAHPTGFAGLTRPGGGAFDGAAAAWSVNSTRDVLTLTGLPVGLVLRVRDYVGFRWTTAGSARRALVRLVEGGIVAGGGAITVTVEPAVPTLTPGGAVATLALPDCVMRLVPDQTRLEEMDVLHSASGVVAAVQDLLP